MVHVTSDLLETYLADYGWAFEPLGGNVWRTGFQGEGRLYPMQIRLTSTCVSFEVMPWPNLALDGLATTQPSREASRKLLELLELNGRLQIVKLGVDQSGELTLSCQVLAAGFDFEMLSKVLGIIGYYAEELTPMIQDRMGAVCPPSRPMFLS